MHKASILIAVCLLGPASGAQAAMLRPFSEITSGTVKLGDLFDQLGETPDRVLGKGPGPGERILVGAAQLAAIARDFNVDWRPSTGSEQAVVERKGKTLAQDVIDRAIRKSLVAQGAPEMSEIGTATLQPMVVPLDSAAEPDVTQCSYDPGSGRFTAILSVSAPDSQPLEQHLSGTVTPLAVAAVSTHRITHGSAITEADFRTTRVRLTSLHGVPPVPPDQLIGMTAKHDILAGQSLTLLDITKPELVARGSLVRMQLHAAGIALTAEGIAKESGAKGDRIRVENPVSHSVVEAEIIGEGEVLVDPNRNGVAMATVQ